MKRKVLCLWILFILAVSSTASGDETPISGTASEIITSFAESTSTGLIETTYDDPSWVLVTSDGVLRENICGLSWYERYYDPCYDFLNRYWKLAPNQTFGEAFPIRGRGTVDGLYIPEGCCFQLYNTTSKPDDPNDLIPYGPLMAGPRYVSMDYMVSIPPLGFEPNTFLVEGEIGSLADYSIIIYDNCDEISLTKVDNVDPNDCRSPREEIVYTICWDNTTVRSFEGTYIVDYLPEEVDYDFIESYIPLIIDPNYSQEDHTYTWQLGTLESDESGCVSLTVTVNEKAEPGMYMHNLADFYFDPNILIAMDTVDTPVCFWDDDPNIIYVDETAIGNDNGVSWADAYSGEDAMQKALRRARESTYNGLFTIYVAQGSYTPGNYANDSFMIPQSTSIYGGFKSGGSDFNERNPEIYETILTGYTDVAQNPSYELNDAVVTMMVSDPNSSIATTLDGFTVTEAAKYGVYGEDGDFDIVNCTIKTNGLRGIYAIDCDAAVRWSKVESNEEHGVYHEGTGSTITIENSHIIENIQRGIFTMRSTPTIKNCLVLGNGYYEAIPFNIDYEGIKIDSPTEVPIIYNNTIIYNADEGVEWYDDADSSGNPNNLDYPDIQNCILYYNNHGGNQVYGFDEDSKAYYSCIQSCDGSNFNTNSAPGFVLTFDSYSSGSIVHPYHYHLTYDSVCKDGGNIIHDTDDVGLDDIDAEDRIYNSRVDIGADEIFSCDDDLTEDDIYDSQLDRNVDGIVNNFEFVMFADAWFVHDPNEPGYTPDPIEYQIWSSVRHFNLDKTGSSQYYIDADDLSKFAIKWLSIPCWKQSLLDRFVSMTAAMTGGESMMMAPMTMSSMSLTIEPAPVPETEPEELTTKELYSLAEGIHAIIEHVDTSIDEDHKNAENLYEMKAFLVDVLQEMQMDRQKKGL